MKTQMQLANKAWRNVSKKHNWHTQFRSKKAWKAFCREQAKYTVLHALDSSDPIDGYNDADYRVHEEILDWN